MEPVLILDPSEHYRPDFRKDIENFRNYEDFDDKNSKENDTHPNRHIIDRVRRTYLDMHTSQCVDFVKAKREKWLKFNKCQMTVMEAMELLNQLVDESDPDIDLPNIMHAFQTAERIREAYPDHDWFHLTGFIHDLGKVMALWGEPQWCVVGDTFPVGCAFGESIVYQSSTFGKNPDLHHPIYSTKNGMYQEHCGLENVFMSWGHDEYLYHVLKHNNTRLPEEALYMIRFHSFYPWHHGRDYMHLCSEKDTRMLPYVLEFNKFDLYSKSDDVPDVEALTPYYQSLIDKYLPGKVEW